MGENSGQIGTKDVSKSYPVPSSSGIEADDYHQERKIQLEYEEASTVSKKVKDTI